MDSDKPPAPPLTRAPFHRLNPPRPAPTAPARPHNKPWEVTRQTAVGEPISFEKFLRRLFDMQKRATSLETCLIYAKAYVDAHINFALDGLARATMELEMSERMQQLEAMGARAGVRPALETALSDYKKVFSTMLRTHMVPASRARGARSGE